MVLFKILFSVILLIGIINPKMAWKISEGWKYKNVEPSTAYLVVNRVVSIVMLVVIWFVIPG